MLYLRSSFTHGEAHLCWSSSAIITVIVARDIVPVLGFLCFWYPR